MNNSILLTSLILIGVLVLSCLATLISLTNAYGANSTDAGLAEAKKLIAAAEGEKTITAASNTLTNATNATGTTTKPNTDVVETTDFSMNIPDNWVYEQKIFGVELAPKEFGVFLLNETKPLSEKMKTEGAYSTIQQDWLFAIKNAGLDLYVKSEIDKQDALNVTSQHNATIDNEPAVKIYGDGMDEFSNIKFVQYKVMHNEEPYDLAYMANVKDYDKYLPEFEQMVKTFKFAK